MLTLLKDVYYSFPIQLLLLSLRRHQLLLAFWIFLFVIVVGRFGEGLGMPAVFLDPEYLGDVGYASFAIVGMAFGVGYVTWNVVLYILNSQRFPFMASLQYPLGMFFLNNCLIPLTFLISYFVAIYRHQTISEFQHPGDVLLDILGFFAGFILMLLITATYFGFTNKNTGSILQSNTERVRRKKAIRKVVFNEAMETENFNRVDYYITNKLNVRHSRTIDHYDPKLHQLVFRRHHLNAFIAFILTFTILVGIGFYLENPFFQIPIAASSFLFMSVLMSLFGMFLYWTGGWGSAAIIIFLLFANQLTKYDLFGYQTQAYGLNYSVPKAPYSLEAIQAIASDSNIIRDKKYFTGILENWKKKNTDPRNPDKRPILYFINISGGGLRAAFFSTAVMQNCDSLTDHKLFDKTFLISGASGGLYGATYLRELFLQKKNGFAVNMDDREHTNKIGKDELNGIALALLSNDALFPYHKFKAGGFSYFKDRGYMFEKAYCNNTGFPFDKTLGDYKKDEYDAKIPLLIYHSTIMNDSRRFYMSPQPISFLMRPYGKDAMDNSLEVDAVDFCHFFEKQDGKNLLVTSAMRMSSTFPFILPNSTLPSEPPTYVMDGGALDNFGIETTLRFLKVFEDWINENTGGVVIIQIRDTEKLDEPEAPKPKTLFSRLTDPIGTVYNNMENMQDFLTDYRLNDMDDDLRGKLHFVLFEYTSANKDEKAGVSFHLTSRDKNDIINSMSRINNVAAFTKLKKLLDQKDEQEVARDVHANKGR